MIRRHRNDHKTEYTSGASMHTHWSLPRRAHEPFPASIPYVRNAPSYRYGSTYRHPFVVLWGGGGQAMPIRTSKRVYAQHFQVAQLFIYTMNKVGETSAAGCSHDNSIIPEHSQRQFYHPGAFSTTKSSFFGVVLITLPAPG